MPFTFFETLTGRAIMGALTAAKSPAWLSVGLFWSLHPLHVLVSALATAAMWRRQHQRKWLSTLMIGYVGSVGIATLSDCVIPYLSTWASLFHIVMATGETMSPAGYAGCTIFLFFAVWIPCCTSDIVFPLLFHPRTPNPKRQRGRK